MATFIASYDQIGSEMERPLYVLYVEGETEAEALAAAQAKADYDETVRGVEPLQPILDRVSREIAAGKSYLISWKDEGTTGPVTLTDLDAFEAAFPPSENGVRIGAVPFGCATPGITTLPWARRSEAKRLAKYLGLVLDES